MILCCLILNCTGVYVGVVLLCCLILNCTGVYDVTVVLPSFVLVGVP